MACERWRELISAQLDGEDDPGDRPRVDEHLAGCAGCREWLERAAAVNRVTRTGLVADVPDLSAAILAALPATGTPHRGGWREWFAIEGGGRRRGGVRVQLGSALYIALAAVGAVQLILGLAQVGGGAASLHVHAGLDATPGHLWHESAAWNVAIGAGYLFIALRRSRPAGLVPMLTAFVGMLLLLSVNDLSAARVDGTRLVSHGFVILGYLLVVALSRAAGDSAEPPGDRAGVGGAWRLVEAGPDEPARPARLRLLPGGPVTARHAPADERRAA
ncbi:zf-HC2 domain-containing protein [Couchioplanes caeruleus]|uniref:zf-HC2 domain-containing protein n=1 Tax=Couchioplanes caeruleus TaxID=56438 RepID=UPI0020BF693E|nr:zf-HC2 domain-containing protein [Couchioplanes caeruleus]UQU64747.1 zf-HC2 domain-containing protein [Couchioplanes caeruleus]